MKKSIDLSIIIPSFNTKALLDRCLSSTIESLQASSLSYEIIVVDNASHDGTRTLLNTKYPRIIKLFNKINLGYGKANNIAVNQTEGKIILLLNSDVQVLGNAIDLLYRFVLAHPKSFVGGKLLNEDQSPQPSCGPSYGLPQVFLMLFCKGDYLGLTRYSPGTARQVDWVSGACLMGQKESFIAVGLFDESIFMYMEEIDFLYRASKKGYTTTFYPHARFIHIGAASSSSRRTPVLNIYRGLVYFYKKHRSILANILLRCLLKTKALAAIAVGRIMGNRDLYQMYEEAFRLV